MPKTGDIIIKNGVKPWPHEMKTATALAAFGLTVEFIQKSEREYEKSADPYIDGIKWEFKSPKSSHLSVVDKNINKALSQSCYIVFDSQRMKDAKDYQVEHELIKSFAGRRKIKSLLFVDKKRDVHKLK